MSSILRRLKAQVIAVEVPLLATLRYKLVACSILITWMASLAGLRERRYVPSARRVEGGANGIT